MSTIGSGLWAKQQAAHPHLLVPIGGIAQEVNDVRQDLTGVLKPLAAIVVEEYTAPVTGTTAMLKAATATTVAVQTVLAAGLLAPGVAALLADGRNVTFTTAGVTPADAPATVLVTGTDMDGAVQTETVALAQTAATASGVKAFKTITSIVYAAGDGVNATIAIGVGNLLGLGRLPKARAGLTAPIREIVNGAAVTTGTFSAANRTYTPASAPNGAQGYAVYYEYDATTLKDQ